LEPVRRLEVFTGSGRRRAWTPEQTARIIADGVARREDGGMIAVPAGIRVLAATKPVDFRRGADSLVALVREQFKHDPFSGTIFVFRSKRADRLKIVAWDGSGLVLFGKRLEQGAFRWPPISDGGDAIDGIAARGAR
jgi:transposase